MSKIVYIYAFVGGREINVTDVAKSWKKKAFCKAFDGKLSIPADEAYDKCIEIHKSAKIVDEKTSD